jgi:hypothetical protein
MNEQTVSHSCSVFNKPSEVVKALGLSAASSIRSGVICGNGFNVQIDGDKLSEASFIYVIRVTVTNEVITLSDERFNAIEGVEGRDFASVYGDSYISGFVRGGDFTGVMSVRVRDPVNIPKVKEALEREASSASDQPVSRVDEDIETNTWVYWTGGGKVMEVGQRWTLRQIHTAASEFPTSCTRYPATYAAIVSPYQRLPSFLPHARKYEIISYVNASLQVDNLLDDYMHYAHLLKNLHLMSFELDQYEKRTVKGSYNASLSGIHHASAKIRARMMIILKQVNEVVANPLVAEKVWDKEPAGSLNPGIFSQYLPRRKVTQPAPTPEVRVAAAQRDEDQAGKSTHDETVMKTEVESPPLSCKQESMDPDTDLEWVGDDDMSAKSMEIQRTRDDDFAIL